LNSNIIHYTIVEAFAATFGPIVQTEHSLLLQFLLCTYTM